MPSTTTTSFPMMAGGKMLPPFEFATATRIRFGAGVAQAAGAHAAELGQQALVVTGNPARAAWLLEALAAAGVQAAFFSVAGEPTPASIVAGLEQAQTEGCDVILGLGGGSALDSAKAIAALLTNGGAPLDYLEVIGRGRQLTQPSAPVIAIPTTAGTGSEVTRNAVLGSPEHGVKASLRSPYMLPTLALVDPLLTHSLPPAVTASTGLDALTQLIEPYVSNRANPLTDAICLAGLPHAARSLRRAYQAGTDAAAREGMAFASLCGGLALANARLGVVHGFAGPLGGMTGAAHGALCAALLPAAMAVNVRALQKRAPDHPANERFVTIARSLTGAPEATAADGVAWVARLCADLAIPPLSRYGLTPADIPTLLPKARQASSMQGNPIPLTDAELTAILTAAL